MLPKYKLGEFAKDIQKTNPEIVKLLKPYTEKTKPPQSAAEAEAKGKQEKEKTRSAQSVLSPIASAAVPVPSATGVPVPPALSEDGQARSPVTGSRYFSRRCRR